VKLEPNGPFTADHLICMSGIETGRTWNESATRTSGIRAGLFQFNQASWRDSGTSIPWDGGAGAKDPVQAAAVALAYLYRQLGRVTDYGNPSQATRAEIEKAIDNFGEGDKMYGAAVMQCADQLASGNFEAAFGTMWNYAQWKSQQ
jgi:hypothetical protein